MSVAKPSQEPEEELLFVPLGGAGEIGMNLNLYGFGRPGAHQWMMVDLGITFSDGQVPGVDVIMPDPAFIVGHRDRLAGLVLTHAHEDHLGAVPYLWDRLRCPIFATPFTATILRAKLADVGLEDEAEITEVPLGGRFTVGPFDLELITLTHSIPEPNAIAIRTPAGTVLHTGDWKFDPDPVVGPTADEDALGRLGDEGVLAMICDSTNVFSAGTSGSEADLLESLKALIGACGKRVVVACFSSNVARLRTIAAAAGGRDVVLVGRSLKRIDAVARKTGYLADVPAFLDEEDAGYLPRDKALLICTGSQGEPRAALARIAAESHPHVTLEEGDTVILSSKIIPGNEMAIARLHNRLVRRGVAVITEKEEFVHVSGHPNRDELVRMYQHVRPRISVPVHGEARHLMEHARLARACQVPLAVVVENGSVVRLDSAAAGVVDEVPAGRLALDGNRVVPMDGALVRGRTRALYNGSAVVTVALDGDGRLVTEAQLSTIGIMEDGDSDIEDSVRAAVGAALGKMPKRARRDDTAVREAVRIAVRRAFRDSVGKKPVTTIHVVRL